MQIVYILLYIVAGITCYIILIALIDWALGEYIYRKTPYEHVEWPPTKTLKHKGINVFHLPFEPTEDEVIYMENEYDEEANLFIQKNMEMITEKIKAKGYKFVYLPTAKFTPERIQSTISYHHPDNDLTIDSAILNQQAETVLKSDFLLDYMVKKRNRKNIRSSFIWYNRTSVKYNVLTHIYDSIEFVGAEALEDPETLMDEVCMELGKKHSWTGALCCTMPAKDADDHFPMESRKMLEEIREKLEQIRMSGISESIIAKYINSEIKLSPLRITPDFRIFLADYKNKEVLMEPLNKAVYILFIRHPEGIVFKDLPDYRRELTIIYNAIRRKENDIETKMAMEDYMPELTPSLEAVTNPLSNSINEKCARIREAFLLQIPEQTALNYFITGTRGMEKRIKLDRNLVIWESAKEKGDKA